MAHTERYFTGKSGEEFGHVPDIGYDNKIMVTQWYDYYCDEKL